MQRFADMDSRQVLELMGQMAVVVTAGLEAFGVDNPGFTLAVFDPRWFADPATGPDTVHVVANVPHDHAIGLLRVVVDRYEDDRAEDRQREWPDGMEGGRR